jgi:hypothetical protein
VVPAKRIWGSRATPPPATRPIASPAQPTTRIPLAQVSERPPPPPAPPPPPPPPPAARSLGPGGFGLLVVRGKRVGEWRVVAWPWSPRVSAQEPQALSASRNRAAPSEGNLAMGPVVPVGVGVGVSVGGRGRSLTWARGIRVVGCSGEANGRVAGGGVALEPLNLLRRNHRPYLLLGTEPPRQREIWRRGL